ncbi:RNA polymerase sigma factor [Kribbella monticola]|uniref:RNA polymerase sigma factor n=1 Tax=Kribbella monticola TaxID=2185285 RepID=UPI001E41AAFE|nr:RNA polymerase sigma factor [Kribbella monticola]
MPLRLVPADEARFRELEARFRELFESHFRELLGYALRRSGSPDDAADVVAETMLVAWRRVDEVPVDGTARLWLYGVARRVLANHRRGVLRRDRLGERLRLRLREATSDLTELVDSQTAVRQAMDQLSDTDRELIRLTSWEDLDPKEAAVVLGVPARVVRTRLHRARSRLKKLLGDAFEDRGHVRDDQLARPAQEER